jgi:hypothetical protein
MRSPSVLRRATKQVVGGERVLFNEDDVPPLSFWEASARLYGASDLTPEDYFNAAKAYSSLATRQSSAWKAKLLREHNLTPYVLHYTALILISGPPSDLWRLGLHMLNAAAELDYAPSILTMVRVYSRAKPDSRAASPGATKAVHRRFQQLVAAGKNPDALTLHGMLLAAEDNDMSDDLALKSFDKALRMGEAGGEWGPVRPPAANQAAREPDTDENSGPAVTSNSGGDTEDEERVRPLRWNWEVSCHTGRARILTKRGQIDEALAALRVATLELDNGEAYVEMAKILPYDATERETYLTKAAVSGSGEACNMLAVMAFQRAGGTASAQAEEHKLWGKEWNALADQD